MKKYLLCLVVISFVASLQSMEDNSVIMGASYVIYNSGGEATFYTYDGEAIVSIKDNDCDMSVRLDSHAGKPQPVCYKIVCQPISVYQGDSTDVSPYFIEFYDKHSNLITSYPFDHGTEFIILSSYIDSDNKPCAQGMLLKEAFRCSKFPLNLSKAVELSERRSRRRKFCSIV